MIETILLHIIIKRARKNEGRPQKSVWINRLVIISDRATVKLPGDWPRLVVIPKHKAIIAFGGARKEEPRVVFFRSFFYEGIMLSLSSTSGRRQMNITFTP